MMQGKDNIYLFLMNVYIFLVIIEIIVDVYLKFRKGRQER